METNLQLSRNLFTFSEVWSFRLSIHLFFIDILFIGFFGNNSFKSQRKDFTWYSSAFNHTLSIAYIFSPREIALAGCLDWFSSLLGFAFYRRLKMISILLKCEWYKYNTVTRIIKVSYVLCVKLKVHISPYPVCMDKTKGKLL